MTVLNFGSDGIRMTEKIIKIKSVSRYKLTQPEYPISWVEQRNNYSYSCQHCDFRFIPLAGNDYTDHSPNPRNLFGILAVSQC